VRARQAAPRGRWVRARGRAVGATTSPLERYVTNAELAELMGVSVRTIKQLTAEGMPSENWGMARTRRYLPSEAIAWARERGRMMTVNRPGRRANVDPS